MTLSDLVQEYRREHGLSQRQFASICGLSNGYISMLSQLQAGAECHPKTCPAGNSIAPRLEEDCGRNEHHVNRSFYPH